MAKVELSLDTDGLHHPSLRIDRMPAGHIAA
jgi:hypothetical protein